MKKFVTVLIILAMVASSVSMSVNAASNVTVYISIVDENRNVVLVQEPVVVDDADGDSVLTVYDALLLSHEQKYEGGAEAGYSVEETEGAASITKLWGYGGGKYGFRLNNRIADGGIYTQVNDGDYINAFVYMDTENMSDRYLYFEEHVIQAEYGKSFTVTLYGEYVDDEGNVYYKPYYDRAVTINGAPTLETDENGQVEYVFDKGDLDISQPYVLGIFTFPEYEATRELCVVPVGVFDLNEPSLETTVETPPETAPVDGDKPVAPSVGDNMSVLMVAGILVSLCFVLVITVRKSRKEN